MLDLKKKKWTSSYPKVLAGCWDEEGGSLAGHSGLGFEALPEPWCLMAVDHHVS